jgi:hypothetical protein
MACHIPELALASNPSIRDVWNKSQNYIITADSIYGDLTSALPKMNLAPPNASRLQNLAECFCPMGTLVVSVWTV